MSLTDRKSRFIYLVSTQLKPDAPAEEWNQWYDGKHVPELMTVPGFITHQRYRQLDDPTRYLAGYQLESPEVFEEARYAEVTGWQGWEKHVEHFDRAVFEITPREF